MFNVCCRSFLFCVKSRLFRERIYCFNLLYSNRKLSHNCWHIIFISSNTVLDFRYTPNTPNLCSGVSVHFSVCSLFVCFSFHFCSCFQINPILILFSTYFSHNCFCRNLPYSFFCTFHICLNAIIVRPYTLLYGHMNTSAKADSNVMMC